MYVGFPLMFSVLMLSYFGDLLANVHDPWNPSNPHGISIILLFWGITAGLFFGLNKYILINRIVPTNGSSVIGSFFTRNFELEPRPLYRNVPAGADVPIHMLPGGDDPFVIEAGAALPDTFVDEYGVKKVHTLSVSLAIGQNNYEK